MGIQNGHFMGILSWSLNAHILDGHYMPEKPLPTYAHLTKCPPDVWSFNDLELSYSVVQGITATFGRVP